MTRKNRKAEFFLDMLRVFSTVLILSVIPAQVFAESARELHKQGVQLFKKEKYDEAAEKFKRAYELKPTWKLLYNIGQCEAVAKRYGPALDAFEQYLVQGGDEVPIDRRDEISNEIRRIQPLVGILEVEAPAGTQVLVDNELRATLPTQKPIRVASGAHEISLVENGEAFLAKSIHIVGGMKTTIATKEKEEPEPESEKEPESEPSAEPDETQPAPLEEESQKPSWMWTTGWIGVGVGAAALIGGTVTGGMTLSKSDELDEKCDKDTLCPTKYKDLQDQAKTLALATNILIPVGGVLAATGVVLLILGRPSKEKSLNGEARMTLLPEVGPGRMGLVIEGRF